MIYVYATLLTLLNLGWLALVLIGLPGTWLMVLCATLATWLTWEPGLGWDGTMFHWGTLLAATGLAVLGELLEFVMSAAGSKKAGGTRRGAIGSIVGAMVGGIVGTVVLPIPVVGTLVGACGGAFVGALLAELSAGRKMIESMRSGGGAASGRLWGTIAKIGVGAVIWVVLGVAAFVP